MGAAKPLQSRDAYMYTFKHEHINAYKIWTIAYTNMVTMTKSDAKKLVTEASCHMHKTTSAIGLRYTVQS